MSFARPFFIPTLALLVACDSDADSSAGMGSADATIAASGGNSGVAGTGHTPSGSGGKVGSSGSNGASATGGRSGGTNAAGGSSGSNGAGGTDGHSGGTNAAGGSSGSNGAGGTDGHSGGTNAAGGSAGSAGAIGTGGMAQPGSGGRNGSGGNASGGTGGSMGGASGTMSTTGGASGSGGKVGNGGSSGSGSVTYTTNFDLSESPISEGGAWHHNSVDWAVVGTANGIAFGTQALGVTRSGPSNYNDSYAYLSGFPPDQQSSAVVHLASNIDSRCTHEVELLLRVADSTHTARAYECTVAYDGSYAVIVRWNGNIGDFTFLSQGSVPGGVHDGDTVSASIVGSQITLSVNGVTRATASDSTFPSGNPGIGLWRGTNGCGTLDDFGFTSFTASSIAP